MLIQLKQKQIKYIRERWHEDQNDICPVLGKEIAIENTALDHSHCKKDELPSDETGKGCCRGVIDKRVNSFEGKVYKAFQRSGLMGEIEFADLLINLGEYLKDNKSNEKIKYIHPSEEPKKRVKKSCYNRLVKAIGGKRSVPKYSGRLTKALEGLFQLYNIEIEFY